MSELFHVGVGKLRGAPGRGSGRYPLGSGKRPYQDYGGGKIKNKKDLADASIKGTKAKSKSIKDYTDDELQSEIKRMNLEKSYKKLKGLNDSSKLETARDIAAETSNTINRTKNMMQNNSQPKSTWSRMDLSKMSDQELRDAINRENLEIQYSKMFNTKQAEINRGEEYAMKVLDVAGDVASVGMSALTIAVLIGKLAGKIH